MADNCTDSKIIIELLDALIGGASHLGTRQ